MEVNDEKNKVKDQLDRELQSIKFTKYQEVIERTHPVSYKQRLFAFWNKEIDIPLVPVSATLAFFLFFVWGGSEWKDERQTNVIQRELVDAGGSTYWKDDLEKVVSLRESKNES